MGPKGKKETFMTYFSALGHSSSPADSISIVRDLGEFHFLLKDPILRVSKIVGP